MCLGAALERAMLILASRQYIGGSEAIEPLAWKAVGDFE